MYGMGRAQAKQEKAFDSYASQSINVDFNNATDGQLLQVDACLLDVDVRRIVEQFWRLADQDKTGTLEYEEYIELSLNLQKALCVRNAEAEDLRGNPDGFDEKARAAGLGPSTGASTMLRGSIARWASSTPVWKSTSVSASLSRFSATTRTLDGERREASPRHRAGVASMAWRATR